MKYRYESLVAWIKDNMDKVAYPHSAIALFTHCGNTNNGFVWDFVIRDEIGDDAYRQMSAEVIGYVELERA